MVDFGKEKNGRKKQKKDRRFGREKLDPMASLQGDLIGREREKTYG